MPHKPALHTPLARTELIKAAKRLRADGHMQTAEQIGSMIENHIGFAEPNQRKLRAPDNSILHDNYRRKPRG